MPLPRPTPFAECAPRQPRRVDDGRGVDQALDHGDAQARVAECELTGGDNRRQPGHVVDRTLPGAVQDLLGKVDVSDLVAGGAGAVVIAGIVAQVDEVGQGLYEGQDGKEPISQLRRAIERSVPG